MCVQQRKQPGPIHPRTSSARLRIHSTRHLLQRRNYLGPSHCEEHLKYNAYLYIITTKQSPWTDFPTWSGRLPQAVLTSFTAAFAMTWLKTKNTSTFSIPCWILDILPVILSEERIKLGLGCPTRRISKFKLEINQNLRSLVFCNFGHGELARTRDDNFEKEWVDRI